MDKRIVVQKELNYIETLYLSCNLQDFTASIEFKDLDINPDIPPLSAYNIVLDYRVSNMIEHYSAKFLGTAKGRDWYQFEDYRLGIMSYDLAKRSNQYNCVIQYEQSHMFTLDYFLSVLNLPFGGSFSDYKIKRIDITKIAKHKENYIEGFNYISPYRGMRYEYGTIYLGHRNNGNVFRLYNKTLELLTDTKNHPTDYKKIELLSQYFGDIEDLYTYELELHRSYLKDTLNIDTLADLDKVYLAYKNIVGQIRLYKDTDKNKRLIASNNRDRISAYVLTDYVPYDRVKRKDYKPSRKYAIKKMLSTMDGYMDSMGLERSNANYISLIDELASERIYTDSQDITLHFEKSELGIQMDEMHKKHDRLRYGQGDTLENEANYRFAPKITT